jgi:putative oxidoreductase
MPAAVSTRAVALIALGYLISVAAYSALPEPRWPVSTPLPPGFGRLMTAFLLPSAAATLYVLLNRLTREPVSRVGAPLKPVYPAIIFTVVLFLVGLHAVVLFGLFAGSALPVRAVPLLLGLTFIGVGNVLPRTRPNLIIGIRTSTTLTNRDVWMRVNRFAGYIAVAFGAALVASAFVPPGRMARDLVSAAAALAVVTLAIGYRRHSRAATDPAAQPSRIGLMGWVLRAPVVLIFLYFGAMKFPNNPASPWPQLFAEIGLGQWFRYFTGTVEVVSAILLLIPRTSRIAAAALVCTMLGAILTHTFVIGVSPAILLPITLLGILALIIRTETARRRR